MQDLELSVCEGVGLIKLARPQRSNAFTLEMIEEISRFVRAASRDDGCRVLVLTGEGSKAFCAGVDLGVARQLAETPLAGRALAWKRLLSDKVHDVAFAIDRCDRPVIAAVNGAAYGAGMDLALMCDMRFATPQAEFCEAYINLGVVPGDGGCHYLPRIVGMPKALELLMAGEPVKGEEALAIGLINRLYPLEELMDQTMAFASKLAAKSPVALQMIKRTTVRSFGMDLASSLDMISSHMGVVQTMPQTIELVASKVATVSGRRE